MTRTLFLLLIPAIAAAQRSSAVERWDTYETTLKGPANGNPFLDVQLRATFRLEHRTVEVDGFYDGEGTYRIRFMPDAPGHWTWKTDSNRPELSGKTGAFDCKANTGRNHGPVVVRNTWHFGYTDGSPYFPVGTTSYAWAHQGDSLEEQTLRTLAEAPFNKMRMCVFPKSYSWNTNEPQYYPFPRTGSVNDFTRFDPAFFRHFENRVRQLRDLGIEADLILFHPYDRWGYQDMPPDVDERYLRYLIARLSAYRNVWWSMANEWDFMKKKTLADFDRYFRIVQQADPYNHLRSIHNGTILYDHAKPWVTHVSIQADDFDKAPTYLSNWKKPLVWDECKYEGNVPRRWGDISGQEMTRRFWLGTALGSYVGHGETYMDPNDILWWSKGGTLHGESPKRIAFLRRIIEQFPPQGLNPLPDVKYPAAGRPGEMYLFYTDLHQPSQMDFDLPGGTSYKAEIIDTWEMTINPLPGEHKGKFTLPLPGKPHQAIRFTAVRK